jgi:hypothetical protein
MTNPDQDDERLGRLLKTEADRYRPDPDRIWRRIRNQMDETEAPAGAVRRSSWLLPAAAAAVIAVVAGTTAAIHHYDHHQPAPRPPAQVAASPTRTPPVSPTRPAPINPSPTKPLPTKPARIGPAVSSTPSAVTTTKSVGGVGVHLAVGAALAGQPVTMPSSARAWLVGSTSSGQSVRSTGTDGISGPDQFGSPTGTAASGPFSLSWDHGTPTRTGVASSTWLSVRGSANGTKTGLQLELPAGPQESELTLYLGAADANAQVTARLEGDGSTAATTVPVRSGGRGSVVTIRFRTPSTDDQLTVQLIDGTGGSVGLAAAVLR